MGFTFPENVCTRIVLHVVLCAHRGSDLHLCFVCPLWKAILGVKTSSGESAISDRYANW